MFSTLKLWTVAVAYLPYVILGSVWFTLLFKRSYRLALGRDPDVETPTTAIFIIGPMLTMLVITLTLAILMQWVAVADLGSAVLLALLVGIGFLVANTVNIAINPNIPRPFLYSLITGSYHLLCICLAAVVLQWLN
ncbi:DUF1761 domain-containing protein [Saccharospirillum sp. HFRX-1]|uniref:DUF1761 domain-containing protein n=1 Tax=unclassified Saccharospirillum TaxID=2633430 RepID=UPI00371A973B